MTYCTHKYDVGDLGRREEVWCSSFAKHRDRGLWAGRSWSSDELRVFESLQINVGNSIHDIDLLASRPSRCAPAHSDGSDEKGDQIRGIRESVTHNQRISDDDGHQWHNRISIGDGHDHHDDGNICVASLKGVLREPQGRGESDTTSVSDVDRMSYQASQHLWPRKRVNSIGHGLSAYPDGSLYRGQFANGCREGAGVWESSTGASYTGEWLKNAAHGRGQHIEKDGGVYTGGFREGRRHGHGQYSQKGDTETLSAGEYTYSGEWREDKPHGIGRKESGPQGRDGSWDGRWSRGVFKEGWESHPKGNGSDDRSGTQRDLRDFNHQSGLRDSVVAEGVITTMAPDEGNVSSDSWPKESYDGKMTGEGMCRMLFWISPCLGAPHRPRARQ